MGLGVGELAVESQFGAGRCNERVDGLGFGDVPGELIDFRDACYRFFGGASLAGLGEVSEERGERGFVVSIPWDFLSVGELNRRGTSLLKCRGQFRRPRRADTRRDFQFEGAVRRTAGGELA